MTALDKLKLEQTGIIKDNEIPIFNRDRANVQEEQQLLSASRKFASDFNSAINSGTVPRDLVESIHTELVKELQRSRRTDLGSAIKEISQNFDKLIKNNPKAHIEKIISSLSDIIFCKQPSSEDFSRLQSNIALDLLRDISDPLREIDQGRSNACGVTARLYFTKHPDLYASFIADTVTKGYGAVGRSENGAEIGVFSYSDGMFRISQLQNRSLSAAIYQSIVLETIGSPEEGLMPADVERFLEARGSVAKIYTTSSDVSSSPQNSDEVLTAILETARKGKSGLISMEFAEDGQHAKHVLELCSQQGVPDGYVRLSNPWDLDEKLPDRYQRMVVDQKDGTFLISINHLRENLYFACLETDNRTDSGKTSDLKEGIYQRDLVYAPNFFEPSYFGFNLREKEKEKEKEKGNPRERRQK